jgi:hypothetical protein
MTTVRRGKLAASRLKVQARLKVGSVDDPAEREADRLAEGVTGSPAPKPSRATPSIDLMKLNGDDASSGLVRNTLESPGVSLASNARALMEPYFGHDFSRVRIHADAAGAGSARAVGAAAYTVGSHIVFAAGRYEPATALGAQLLAHELAHVVQQRTSKGPLRRQPDLEAALAGKEWAKVAEILNGFSEKAINEALARLRRGDVGSIHAGALDNPRVGPGSAIAKATRPAYLDLNYENEMKKGAWTEAAKFLNGFNQHDIETRLQKLTDDQLEKIHDGALDNPALGDKSSVAIVSHRVMSGRKSVVLYKKAGSFQELIDLVRAAEGKLAGGGITTAKEQIHALRGIFYGTTWSLDYSDQGSKTRNEGFQRFTRPSEQPATSEPRDVRRILGRSLVDALKISQDVVDPGGRHVDFGHLIIGLDARFDPAFASNIKYPVKTPLGSIDVDLGGTGTELVTWLGDLGGAAASLAIKRLSDPVAKATSVFTGSDYGGSINLEGDVAGSVVASASPSAVTTPSLAPGKRLSDALVDYLSPAAPTAAWKGRATTFLTMNGGIFDPSGSLTNRTALITAFQTKILEFSCNYLASRVGDKKVSVADAKAAAHHVVGTSEEVATAFVDALIDSHKSGGKIQATRFPTPKPAGSSACRTQLFAAGLVGP